MNLQNTEQETPWMKASSSKPVRRLWEPSTESSVVKMERQPVQRYATPFKNKAGSFDKVNDMVDYGIESPI